MAAVLAATATPSAAQSDRFAYLGAAAGFYTGYPTHFSGPCSSIEASLSLKGTAPVNERLSLRGTLTNSGTIGTTDCVLALFAPPVPGTESTVTSIPGDIGGTEFTSTRMELVYEAYTTPMVRSRLRVGGGRIWGKSLWLWSWGGEFRVGPEAAGWIVGVDGLNFGYDVTEELIRWGGPGVGPDVLLSSRTFKFTERPIRFWTGIEFALGS